MPSCFVSPAVGIGLCCFICKDTETTLSTNIMNNNINNNSNNNKAQCHATSRRRSTSSRPSATSSSWRSHSRSAFPVAIDNQITALYGLQGRGNQSAAATHGASSPLATRCTDAELMMQWLPDALVDDPFANAAPDANQNALLAVAPPKIDTLNGKDESDIQAAFNCMKVTEPRTLVDCSQTPMTFGVGDDQTTAKPGLVLFAGPNTTVDTIVAVIELKTAVGGGMPHKTANAVKQCVDYGVLAMRVQRHRAFMRVVVTNGASFCQVIEISRTAAEHDYFRSRCCSTANTTKRLARGSRGC